MRKFLRRKKKEKREDLRGGLLRMAENEGLTPNDTKKLQTARTEKYAKGKDKMESELTEILSLKH
jgi:hypothetical protein